MCIGEIHALLGKRIHIGRVNRSFSVHRIGTATQVVNGDKEHIGVIAFVCFGVCHELPNPHRVL